MRFHNLPSLDISPIVIYEKNAKNITGDSSIFEKSPATNFILYSNKLNGLIALSFL